MKKLILFILFSSIWLYSFSQEQLKHDKKIYRSSDGRLFLHKSIPVYIKLSVSPSENAQTHILTSQRNDFAIIPVYFIKEGPNLFAHPYAVDTVTKEIVMPKKNTEFFIYADSKAPVSLFKFIKVNRYDANGIVYVGKNLETSLTANDEVSGVENIYFSLDNSAFTVLSNQPEFINEKAYDLKYYAVDNVGNVEKQQNVKFTVDLTPPVSYLKFEGDLYDTVISARSFINLTSSDANCGLKKLVYKIDDENEIIYNYKIPAASLNEGEHMISYFGVDHVLNTENTHQLTFFVDKTPPIIIEELLGDTYIANGKEYSSGRTKLKLTAIDNKAGVKAIYYSINNGPYVLYEKPFYLNNQKGNINLKAYAIDNVGNKSSTEGSGISNQLYQSYVDLTGPELNYNYIGPTFKMRDTVYISNVTKIQLKGSDAESGLNRIVFNLDGNRDSTFAIPFSVNGNGLHRIDYFGYDNVSNSNQGNFYFKVDDTGPEIISQFSISPYSEKTDGSNKLQVYPEHAILFLASFDKGVGVDKVFYSINNEPEHQYLNIIQNLRKGTYNIKVRAIDKLGNENRKEINFVIE